MDFELFIDRVQRWGGIAQKREAEQAILAALKALREAMTDDDAAILVQALPERLTKPMQTAPDGAVADVDQLYRRAARYERVRVGVALEHVQAVCRALASLLPKETMAHLTRALPKFAELFVVSDRSPPPVVSMHRPTLAEGRSGSRHPLSEARRGSERPVSEARPPDLDAGTIAEGRPGSEHPLSDARPGSEHPVSEARPRGAGRPRSSGK